MKLKLYVNENETSWFSVIVTILIMMSHKWTGLGFLGFTFAIINIINTIEVTASNIHTTPLKQR